MASTSASVESSASSSVEISATTSVESNMVLLKSSDGETFEVEEKVIMQSETIKHMIEDIGTDTAMPVPNVVGKILAMVIEYCNNANKHADDGAEVKDDDKEKNDEKNEEKKTFDAEFVNVGKAVLFGLILAADYLNIKSLLDLTCQKVADNIKNMTPEEVREYLNIKNDYNREEEDEVRKENAWAFE